jgi:hypothetical protein
MGQEVWIVARGGGTGQEVWVAGATLSRRRLRCSKSGLAM